MTRRKAGTLVYEHDGQAHDEAVQYALSEQRLAELGPLIAAKRVRLGPEGIRGHRVAYNAANWKGLIPKTLAQHNKISRGEVFDLAASGDLMGVFAASFLWESGDRAYGPHRYHEIVASADGRLCDMLTTAAAAAAADAIGGYAMLFGGSDPKSRVAPNTEPWTRIDRFGPAFFTKFMYFTTPGALILDNVLANKVKKLSGMPHLVQNNGDSYQWSPYRYAVYLHWMGHTAAQLECAPDELEITLFAPPRLV